jgi:O-antigen ligase
MPLLENSLPRNAVNWAVFLFPLIFVFPFPVKAVLYLTLLGIAVYLLLRYQEARQVYKKFKSVALAFGLYLPYSLLDIWIKGGPLNAADNAAHFLFFLCIAVCFTELRSQRIFWVGISLAAIGCGAFAIYQRFGLGIIRPYGMYGISELGLSGSIKFGMVTAIFSLLSLTAALYSRGMSRERLVYACAALVGFAGCQAIGSRGPWLVLLFIGLVLVSFKAMTQHGKARWLTMFLAISSAALVMAVFHSQIYNVLLMTSAELTALGNGDFSRSFGQRIAMWKAAVAMFVDYPFFGVGMNQFGTYLRQMIASGDAPGFLAHHGHTHNEYFEALATGGLVGLGYLLWLFGASFIFFLSHLVHRRNTDMDTMAPLGGLITVSGFALFAMGDNIFDRQMTTSLFAFLVLGFAAMTAKKSVPY